MFRTLTIGTLAAATVGYSTVSNADSSFLSSSPGKDSFLFTRERLVSPSQKGSLVVQADGNLVAYRSGCGDKPDCAFWNTGTDSAIGQYHLALQDDGNVVLYRGTPAQRTHLWASKTAGERGNYFLIIQDDDNLVLYRGTGPADNRGAVWSTKTGRIADQIENQPSPHQAKVELGSVNISDCSRWKNGKWEFGNQRAYAYAYVDGGLYAKLTQAAAQCFSESVGACGLASLVSGPAACLPTFKWALSNCLQGYGAASIVDTVRLSIETKCRY